MILKAYNKGLIEDTFKTFLTASVAATGTTLTVKDNTSFADDDYLLLGEIGEASSEIVKIGAAVVAGTSITTGACVYAHSIDTPVYKLRYNQIQFARATTLTGTKTQLGSDTDIDPTEEWTIYEDTANSTGYGFIRWYNETTTKASSYSGGVNYTYSSDYSSFDAKTLFRLIKRVRTLLSEDRPDSKVSDDQIRDELNDKQRDIAHRRLWSFYEDERSLSSVADQWAYDISSNVQKIHLSIFDTQPLAPMSYIKWKKLHWDTNTSTEDPSGCTIWNNQLLIYPRPSASANADTLNDEGDITATDTTIILDDTSGFQRGDYYRFIIDSEVVYATGRTHFSTPLTADVAITDTTITVADASAFASSGTMTIDEDVITYTGTTDTTFTGCSGITATHDSGDDVVYSAFTGCLRGREDTTAAIHSDGVAVTERDIVYSAHVEPTDLFLVSDRTKIPEPEVLSLGAASKLALLIEKETLSDRLVILYKQGLKDLESKYSSKVSSSFSRVKASYEIVSDYSTIDNPNLYPKSINT